MNKISKGRPECVYRLVRYVCAEWASRPVNVIRHCGVKFGEIKEIGSGSNGTNVVIEPLRDYPGSRGESDTISTGQRAMCIGCSKCQNFR
jgi:hypothetical protein